MKVKFEFDTSDFDQKEELEVFKQALDMSLLIWEFENEVLRKAYKYDTIDDKNIDNLTKEEVIELISDAWYSIKQRHNVDAA